MDLAVRNRAASLRINQPRQKSVDPTTKTLNLGGSVHDLSKSLARLRSGHNKREPAPKSWRICDACAGIPGSGLRCAGSESAVNSSSVIPHPSDDFRRRKTPFKMRVREPRTNTKGIRVNFFSS